MFLYQGKHAKLQWLQDPNQNNIANENSIRHEASRHFRNKKKKYLRAKIDKHETDSKIKYIRDLYRIVSVFEKVTSLELI